uniref:Uncharacterized protein n=1 Tax=Strigops habroptila TaxID=2489341 RepID=A0A672TL74_STRHB
MIPHIKKEHFTHKQVLFHNDRGDSQTFTQRLCAKPNWYSQHADLVSFSIYLVTLAVLWIHEGTSFLANFLFFFFSFVPVCHVLVNVFSEQDLVVQSTHPYSPAPCCLPRRTSAPAMQPMPRMQTTIPMKCTAFIFYQRESVFKRLYHPSDRIRLFCS